MVSIKKDNTGLVSGFICLNSKRQKQPIKYLNFKQNIALLLRFKNWASLKVKSGKYGEQLTNIFISDLQAGKKNLKKKKKKMTFRAIYCSYH